MAALVQRLSNGRHPVAAARAESAAELKESIGRGYVLVTFRHAGGATELGVFVDKERSTLGEADFAKAQGVIRLVGRSILNDHAVELRAELDLATLSGEGDLST